MDGVGLGGRQGLVAAGAAHVDAAVHGTAEHAAAAVERRPAALGVAAQRRAVGRALDDDAVPVAADVERRGGFRVRRRVGRAGRGHARGGGDAR
ncbi:MAG: hypothetical protein U1E39_09690 [Planctomycetota bacterium]